MSKDTQLYHAGFYIVISKFVYHKIIGFYL